MLVFTLEWNKDSVMKHLFLALVLLLPSYSYADSDSKENLWEISFGNTQLFSGWYNGEDSYLPTSSTTLILSYRVYGDFALWGVFNLPLVPNQKLTKDGELIRTKTPPALMFGASYEIVRFKFDKKRWIGIDTGLSVGRALVIESRFFPVGATRLKVIKDKDTTYYIGLTTSPYNSDGDLVFGLVYGAGMRF